MVEAEAVLATCLTVGRQYHLQRRIVSAEAVSTELFANALRLAGNRRLLDPGAPDRAQRRQALSTELHEALRRLEALNEWDCHAISPREGSRQPPG
jgi:glycerol-3-phosphate O-acyltransferase